MEQRLICKWIIFLFFSYLIFEFSKYDEMFQNDKKLQNKFLVFYNIIKSIYFLNYRNRVLPCNSFILNLNKKRALYKQIYNEKNI